MAATSHASKMDKTFLEALKIDLENIQDELELTFEQSFLFLFLQYFGFDFEIDDDELTDGKNDWGFDYVQVEETAATIVQSKSQDFSSGIDAEKSFGPDYLTDIDRINTILKDLENLPKTLNTKVRNQLTKLRSHLRRLSERDMHDDIVYNITVFVALMGLKFTDSGQEHFEKHAQDGDFTYEGLRCSITYRPIFIGDLLAEKWKQTNTRWKDNNNKKLETIRLNIVGEPIRDKASVTFFAKAKDLVSAYEALGYQIFEANVRCELKNSKVNTEIRKSIETKRGREEFKYLNNGITIVCPGFSYVGPKNAPEAVKIRHPGVINGLQTIRSMADAYDKALLAQDRTHFDEKCHVLVRLHRENAVADYRALVKSTNLQNPMRPRNLKSNETEQIAFEKVFAEIGWFYERKEGAWNAFSMAPKAWSSLSNKNKNHFIVNGTKKVIDNEQVAQSWLSFIGFSAEAVDKKRFLFSDEKLYELIFALRTDRHGFDCGFKVNSQDLLDNATRWAPSHRGLITSYLLWEFAKKAVLTRKENRDEAVKRLGLDGLTKEQADEKLMQDDKYLTNLVLRGLLLEFVEFVGFILFRSFGETVHDKFGNLLKYKSFKTIFDTGDFVSIRDIYLRGDFDDDDLLLVYWALYNHCLSQLMATAWKREWETAANRSKFNYSEKTRGRLLDEILEADKVFEKQIYIKYWTGSLNNAKGVLNLTKKILG